MSNKFPHRIVKLAVRRVIRRRGLSARRWADDLTAEANLAAVKAMSKAADNPDAYIYRACVRACSAYVEREWRHESRIESVDMPLARDDGSPQAAVLLTDIFSVCDPIDARIIELRALPFTHEQASPTLEAIGRELGLSKSTVYKRLQKIAQRAGIEETNNVFDTHTLLEGE